MFFEYDKEAKESLDEYDFLVDGHIYIPPHIWREVYFKFTKKELIAHLSNIIEENKLPYPAPEYKEGVLRKDFKRLQTEVNVVKEGEWVCMRTMPPNVPLEFNGRQYYIQATNNCLKVSDQQSHLERAKCGHFNHRSPWQEWTREHHKSKLRPVFSVMWRIQEGDCLKNGVGKKQFRDCLRLGNYLASQFKPSCAKTLYDFFEAKNVLDFSMGWGDRLVGFLGSNAESYVGIDPNSKMQEPYRKIKEFCNVDKKTRFICSPAEDADLSDVKVDFVFTSPPYFDIERYSDEDTQSWKRYSEVALWVEGFLCKTLKKCWDALEEGGRICVNIADKKGSNICEPMIEYMKSLGATYEGVIGYEMMKRPGNKIDEVFCEPIWIWSKGEAKDPNWSHNLFFS